ncbi:MAG: hypothetical protein CGW95_02225 [Phenylobacterium zucineum]|nr:MAG: hypothetical protein CGW95_02225 [Phenylobacterium zucineum]
MGVKASWLAMQRPDREAVLEALGLTEIGDCSYCLTGDYTCADLPNGWFVIVDNKQQLDLTPALGSVSAKLFALKGEMSETVMVSELIGYEGGAQVWSVVHDPDVDINGAQVEGVPPPAFAQIKALLTAQMEEDDEEVDFMFDLPLDLSEAICGFRPDKIAFSEWTQLSLKSRLANARAQTKVSLRAEMKKELIPFMLARGWAAQTDSESGGSGNSFDFHRRFGPYNCQLGFEYASSPDLWISPAFYIQDVSTPDKRNVVSGRPVYKTHHIPFWKRLLGLEKPPPPIPDDPVADQIEKTKALVMDMEAYIETGELRATIGVSLTKFAKSWPEKAKTPQT